MEDGQASSHTLSRVEVVECFEEWMQLWGGRGECLCDELVQDQRWGRLGVISRWRRHDRLLLSGEEMS